MDEDMEIKDHRAHMVKPLEFKDRKRHGKIFLRIQVREDLDNRRLSDNTDIFLRTDRGFSTITIKGIKILCKDHQFNEDRIPDTARELDHHILWTIHVISIN